MDYGLWFTLNNATDVAVSVYYTIIFSQHYLCQDRNITQNVLNYNEDDNLRLCFKQCISSVSSLNVIQKFKKIPRVFLIQFFFFNTKTLVHIYLTLLFTAFYLKYFSIRCIKIYLLKIVYILKTILLVNSMSDVHRNRECCSL